MKEKLKEFQTKEEAIKFVESKIVGLAHIEKKWTDDRDVVLAAVKTYGYNLEHASKRLRADKEIVLAAIARQPRALSYASKDLRNDPEIRALAFAYSHGPFIVDPIAMEVFSRLDCQMIAETVKKEVYEKFPVYGDNGKIVRYIERTRIVRDENDEVVYDEEAMRKHPFYKKFKKFYDGTITATELLKLENELLKSRFRYLDEKTRKALDDEYNSSI